MLRLVLCDSVSFYRSQQGAEFEAALLAQAFVYMQGCAAGGVAGVYTLLWRIVSYCALCIALGWCRFKRLRVVCTPALIQQRACLCCCATRGPDFLLNGALRHACC